MTNKITILAKSISLILFGVLSTLSINSQVVLTTTQTDPLCTGTCDGMITCSATGGAGAYEYSIDGLTFLPSTVFSGLCAGNYSVIARDTLFVADTIMVNIIDPPLLQGGIVTSINESFSGACDGSASVTANGGVGGYSYNWSTVSSTNSDSALCSGNHDVTITDANGCMDTVFIYIDSINNPCAGYMANIGTVMGESFPGGCDGYADVFANGTAPYTYNWSSGSTTNSDSALCYGNYNVTVTDFNGCMDSILVFIDSAPNPCGGFFLNVGTVIGESFPGACDGYADVFTNGGTAPFNYNWSSGSTTNSDSALCYGNYNVMVTDFNGCTDSIFVFIDSAPNPCGGFYLNVGTVMGESFPGACDGYADVFTNAGTAPYTYNWSSGSTTNSDSMLCFGNYNVMVTDFNGCMDSIFVFIDSAPNPCGGFFLNIGTVMGESFSGSCDGYADVFATGGTVPYNYNWSSGSTTNSDSMLCYGNYNVMVTDFNGCMDSIFVFIDSAANPCGGFFNNIGTIMNESAPGACDGSVSVTTVGGTAPYNYNWSNGLSTATASGLCAGSYSLSIMDFNGCFDSVFVNIFTDSTICGMYVLDSAVIITDATCSGQDGSITGVTINAGFPPYTYQWTGGTSSNNTTLDLFNATPGTAWMLTVTDSTGCSSSTQPLNINQQNSNLTITITTTNASCSGLFDGQASVTVTGGTAPYNYQWSNGAGNVSNNISLVSDSGWVQVTDANNCTSNQEAFITNEPSAIIITGSITAENCGTADGSISLSVFGGIAPYAYSWSQGSLAGVTNNANGLTSGLYEVTVVDANGCYENGSYSVANNSFSVIGTSTPPSCYGGNDGNIDITITPPGAYTFLWSNGDNTEDATSLEEGFYSVIISNGSCQLVHSVTLSGSLPIDLSSSSAFNTSGCNTSDGSINVVGMGGTGPLSFELYGELGFMGAGTSFSTLFPGAYQIFATDANGCMDSSFINVSGTAGTPINITLDNVSSATCSGMDQTLPSDGIANITVSGGIAPYQFYWRKYTGNQTLMSTAEDPTTLSSGNYTLEVTDQAGCSEYLSLEVPGSNLAPQNICLVTVGVDNANNQENIIVWEKNVGLGIDRYEIWREELNGAWQKRGTVLYSELSQFADNGVDPNAVSYKYRLKTIDECNNVSVFQAEHRSVQLSFDNYVAGVFPVDGSIDLSWNAYVGINNLTNYIVERIIYSGGVTTSTDVGTIPVVAGQMNYTFTDNAIPELPLNTSLFYTIRVDLAQTCSATKAQDHNSTRSNRASIISDGGFPTGITSNEDESLSATIFPNPTSGILKINLNGVTEPTSIRVFNTLGKLVYSSTINGGYNTLDLAYLQNGLYYIELISNGSKSMEAIVIQK